MYGKTEMTILRVRLETAGEAKTLGEVAQDVMANAGSTAMPQCSTDEMTMCAGSTATMKR